MSPARPPAPRPSSPVGPAKRPPAPRRVTPQDPAGGSASRRGGSEKASAPGKVPTAGASPSPAKGPARPSTPSADRSSRSPVSSPSLPSASTVSSPSEAEAGLGRVATPVVVSPRRTPVVSTGSAARFAERARAQRARLWRRIGWSAGVAAVLGGLGWLLLGSPVLALDPEQVVVTGAGTVVSEGDVDAVIEEVAGIPLPRLDTIGLRSAVLDVPGVREARVTRAWPRGLAISLVAREPVAAVPAEKGVQLLDVEGVAVGRASKAPKGLPLVDVPVGDARTLQTVLGVLEALPEDLKKDLRSVSAQTQDTVTMVLRDGARVDWGSAEDTELKAAVLQALRSAKASRDASWFDVSAPTLPVTKSS